MDDRKYCGMHKIPVRPYTIRDKVFIVSLYEYGEGEPPIDEIVILANSEDHAMTYYNEYRDTFTPHTAISIKENKNE